MFGRSQAIKFVKDRDEDELWEALVTRGVKNPEFAGKLLEHVGTHLPPLVVIDRIPEKLEIPGLRDKVRRSARLDLSRGGRSALLRGAVCWTARDRCPNPLALGGNALFISHRSIPGHSIAARAANLCPLVGWSDTFARERTFCLEFRMVLVYPATACKAPRARRFPCLLHLCDRTRTRVLLWCSW